MKPPAAVTPAPEDDVIQVKWVLDDAGGGYSDPQNVLLGGHVPRGSDAFQIVKVTAEGEERCDKSGRQTQNNSCLAQIRLFPALFMHVLIR